MKLRFYVAMNATGSGWKDRVLDIAESLKEGGKIFGDELEVVHNGAFITPSDEVDVACVWGIMGNSADIVKGYRAAGKRVLVFDKALIRSLGAERRGHYRIGIDSPSPLKYMMRTPKSWERWESHRIDLAPRRVLPEDRKGGVLYAGSSQKYCDFYGLGDANDYAESILNQARAVLRKAVMIYRPKPSWTGARFIGGTRHSGKDEDLFRVLKISHVLVTHGSAAALEAIVGGVPVVTLGPCVAAPVANKSMDDLRDLYFPSDEARFHWLSNVAWCQWNADELRSGEAWQFIRGELEATA